MNVLVVGGGIAGLTSARALAQRGHHVTLWERAPRFEAVGAGIILAANAVACLRALGVDPADGGLRLDAMDGIDDQGALLSGLDLAAARDRVGPVYTFARPELHDLLVRALPPGVEVRLGVTIDGVTADADGVTVHAGGEVSRWDVVLGADGLRSAVRRAIAPEARLRYSGETCWRTIVPYRGPARAVEAWGVDGHRFGVVPLTNDRAYLFLVSIAPEGDPTPPWAELSRRFGAFRGPPAEVWPGVTPDGLMHHDLVELERAWWGTPRVWLLGDAAHGMTPNLGQGAGMGIEDAAALALHFGDDLPAAHAAWVAARAARVDAMATNSRRMGQVARLANPALRWVRDHVVRWFPTGDGVYRDLVGPGLALAEALQARA